MRSMLDLTQNRYSSQWRAENDGDMRQKLVSLVTEYDRQQEQKGKGYNKYALAQYLEAASDVAELIKKGTPKDRAIDTHFDGQLAALLKRKL